MAKKVIVQDLPLHIGFFVYQYAKMKMLEFYYDVIHTFVDTKDFELIEMDTDSMYMALSASSIESVIKSELQESFFKNKGKWFVSDVCNEHKHEKSIKQLPCCAAAEKYSTRTPGLFKVEWTGNGMIALNSKTYYGFGTKNKISCKGLNKQQNDLTKEKYLHVLTKKESVGGKNIGFISKCGKTYTYSTFKNALTYFYGKRKVQNDGRSTKPLEL